MSFYSSVDRRINADSWFRGLSHEAQLIWLRLLFGAHVTPVAGLWAATESGLAEAFGFDLKRFRERLRELCREPGKNGLPRVVFDWSAGVIWLPNAIHQECNQPANPNVLLGWRNYLDLIPECAVKDQAIRGFKEWVESHPERFKKGWPNGFPNPSANSMANNEQENEQEQEQDLGDACASPEPKKPSRGSCRVPEDWEPNDKHRALAAEHRVRLANELAKFRDHEFAKPKKDFDAAFSNWLRNASGFASRGSGGGRRQPVQTGYAPGSMGETGGAEF